MTNQGQAGAFVLLTSDLGTRIFRQLRAVAADVSAALARDLLARGSGSAAAVPCAKFTDRRDLVHQVKTVLAPRAGWCSNVPRKGYVSLLCQHSAASCVFTISNFFVSVVSEDHGPSRHQSCVRGLYLTGIMTRSALVALKSHPCPPYAAMRHGTRSLPRFGKVWLWYVFSSWTLITC